MSFDPGRYEETVLKPLRGATSLPDDLVVRYAIEPGMGADTIGQHLRRVRSFWNQKAGSAGSLPRVCKLLLSADEELQRRHGERMLDPRWWQEQEQSRRQRTERGSDALRQPAIDLSIDHHGVHQQHRVRDDEAQRAQ